MLTVVVAIVADGCSRSVGQDAPHEEQDRDQTPVQGDRHRDSIELGFGGHRVTVRSVMRIRLCQ